MKFSDIFKSREQREYEAELLKLNMEIVKKRKAILERAYEAAQSSQYWPRRGDTRSGNNAMEHAQATLRSWSRFLDENHDLAVGILDEMEKKIVGCGTQFVPMATGPNGKPAKKFNAEIKKLWKNWTTSRPDATRTLSWTKLECLVVRSWLRDGEVLIQHIEGNGPIRHRSLVPYSIELIEADYLPFKWMQTSSPTQNRIVHGVEMSDWNEPIAYYLYKEHPGDVSIGFISSDKLKKVSSDRITHLKFTRRIGQVRGVPIFHATMHRLEDIKEYEESERIAARVAAAMCAVIKKPADFQGAVLNAESNRTMEFNPGMIFDNLAPGEDVSMIGSDRPNPNLEAFVNSQIRRVAAGTGTSFSSVSKDYNGTYSAQRQELVESFMGYEKLREIYQSDFLRPVYARFVRMAIASGLVSTVGVDLATAADVDLIGPSMPWIDPVKEVNANKIEVESGFKSRQMVVREHQYDLDAVDDQLLNDPMKDKLGAPPAKPEEPKAKPEEEEDDEQDDDENRRIKLLLGRA